MIDRLRGLRNALFIVLVFPTIHVGYTLVITIHQQGSLLQALTRFLFETIVLVLSPSGLIKGRFPTGFELSAASIWQIFLLAVCIAVIWLYLSALMIGVGNIVRPLIDRHLRRWSKVGIVMVFSTALILWMLLPYQPSPDRANIHINLAETVGQMPPLQSGFSQGGEIQMRDEGYFETAMFQLSQLDPAFVRIDHLYDYYDVYGHAEDGTPVYDWTELDRVVDAILEAGAEPFMSISYTPAALANGAMSDPPTDLGAWEELVFQTVYHFNIERGLNIRYWEVWNEPNLGKFWSGTPENFFELYAMTARGVLRADSSVLVGGIGTASQEQYGGAVSLLYERDWVVGLVDYVIEHDLRLDFLSWHLYDTHPDNFRRSIERHQAWVSRHNPQPQLIISEWNWSAGTSPRHDNGGTLAYIAAVLDVLLDSPLDIALFFEPIDGTLMPEGYWGLMYRDGTPKPVFFGFQLLSRLSGDLLQVSSSHPDAGAIATRDGDSISIVLWNFDSGHDPLPMTVTLSGLPNNQSIGIVVTDLQLKSDLIEVETNDEGQGEIEVKVANNGLRLLSIEMTAP